MDRSQEKGSAFLQKVNDCYKSGFEKGNGPVAVKHMENIVKNAEKSRKLDEIKVDKNKDQGR